MKRLFDIFFSTTFLILFSPLLFILSILIYLQDKGPVFFIQNRVGYKGKIFKLIKFRTMSVPKTGHHYIELGDKSRVTSIGRILRKSKLDELPQLINVLKGEMSIVGPRPEVPQFMNNYQDQWIIVQRIKPGLTDNASIEFRNEEEILTKAENPNQTYIKEILPKKLEYYQQYEKDHTMWEDLKIIFKTIYVVIFK